MTNTEIIEPQDKALITDLGRWFTNLRKWQKGYLIGCITGIVLAVLAVLGLHQYQMGTTLSDWVLRLHSSPAVIFDTILPLRPYIVADLATAGSIVVIYGVYGDIVGRFQQVTSTPIRWLLTAFAVIFLLFIYWFNFQVAMLFENIF